MKAYLTDFLYGNKLTAFFRIILGLLFLVSGFSKTMDIVGFGKIIINYGIIPEWFAPYPAIVLPFLEILLGINLVIGYKIKASSFISIFLMIFFIIIIFYALISGKEFDCGCFNLSSLGLVINEKLSYKLLIRNIIMLILFLIIFRLKRYRISMESLSERIGLQNLE